MAKPEDGTGDTDSRKAKNATELKKELLRQIKPILDEDDYEIKATDVAIRNLSSLKELKARGIEITNEATRLVSSLRELKFNESAVSMVVPEEFKCPISSEIMVDPIVLATGQTCDRGSIQEWLDKDHRTRPETQQILSYSVLIPNNLVRQMISQWCKKRGIELPKSLEPIIVPGDVITDADRHCLNSLLNKMSSSSLSDQKMAAKELRRLTRWQPSFQILFGETSDAISNLLEPLLSPSAAGTSTRAAAAPDHMLQDPNLQEDLITTLFNVSIPEKNKRLVAENPVVIPLLIKSLKTGSTIKTKSNAAAALTALAAFDSNKIIIGDSGALKPLIDVLEEGHPLVMRDVLRAMCQLCIGNRENRVRAVRDGAARVILEKIKEGKVLVDELLYVLAMLSNQQEAVEEMGEIGAVPCLLSIMRKAATDEINQVNCAAILLDICLRDRSKRKEIMEAEIAHGTLSRVAVSSNSKAKTKANAILDKVRK